MDHGDDDGDGAGLDGGDDVEASSLSGAPGQQDLIPLRGNQEFRRRRDLGWTREN